MQKKDYLEGIVQDIETIKRGLLLQSSYFKKANLGLVTSSEWAVLRIIYGGNTPIPLKDIAKSLSFTSSAATQHINNLVKKGLVVRKEGGTDRRVLALTLSGKGKKQLDVLKAEHAEKVTKLFESLSDAELKAYYHLNQKIAKTIVNT